MQKDLIIDRKFKINAVNPCKPDKPHTERDSILFLAKDRALPATLDAYMEECRRIGADEVHIEAISLMRERVVDYQEHIDNSVPDTNAPCEIDRCIGGIGVESAGESGAEPVITSFFTDLMALLNRYSKENVSNTSDFILATFLIRVLDSYEAAVVLRDEQRKVSAGSIPDR